MKSSDCPASPVRTSGPQFIKKRRRCGDVSHPRMVKTNQMTTSGVAVQSGQSDQWATSQLAWDTVHGQSNVRVCVDNGRVFDKLSWYGSVTTATHRHLPRLCPAICLSRFRFNNPAMHSISCRRQHCLFPAICSSRQTLSCRTILSLSLSLPHADISLQKVVA